MTSASDAAGDNRSSGRRFREKAVWVGAVGGATFLLCGILFRMAVDPSQLRCAAWLDPVAKGAWAPAWMLAPLVALWAVSVCFGAGRWGWFARRQVEGPYRRRGEVRSVLTIAVGWPLVLVVTASVLLGAAPIVAALGRCHFAL